MGRKDRITKEFIPLRHRHTWTSRTTQNFRSLPLTSFRVASTEDKATAGYHWGGNKSMEGDPQCGAGTQGRLKAKVGTKLSRKTL